MCSAKSFQLFAKVAMCPPRGSISKIAMLLCVITVRQHSSIAILLMDPRGIWLMKPGYNLRCLLWGKAGYFKNSNAAVLHDSDHTQQHCYFADGPSWGTHCYFGQKLKRLCRTQKKTICWFRLFLIFTDLFIAFMKKGIVPNG